MQKVRFLILCWCWCMIAPATEVPPSATEPSTAVIEVRVTGLKVEVGAVRMALYAEAKRQDFPTVRSGALATQRVPIHDLSASGRFTGLIPGAYAVAVFHDRDDDDVLDTNWLGIPNEPVGASNNAKGSFGPPSFADASIALAAGATLVVDIRLE